MIGTVLPVLVIGLAAAWILLWSVAYYYERDTNRESPVRMAFYLSALAVGGWVAISVLVGLVGGAVWYLVG